MEFFDKIIEGYEAVLHFVAEFTVHTLEMVGIAVVIIGSIRAIIQILSNLRCGGKSNVIIPLARALAIALEFKMGAEIVNTVIIRDLEELVTLAIVIALHAVLSVLIHWEIKSERKDEQNDHSGKKEIPETEKEEIHQ
jgi:uncharacterized membrane protein